MSAPPFHVAVLLVLFQTLPWVMPGDFLERFRISDVVVSGTIESTTADRTQTVDGINVEANTALLEVDRVFQGQAPEQVLFTWFSLPPRNATGFVYSGAPLASFRPHVRYLVFLKRNKSGLTTAMPAYAFEVTLAPEPPKDAVRDSSDLPPHQRYEAVAEELEMAALRAPAPPPGLAGEAPTYFSPVLDLIGGCAAPFYRQFLSSSNEDVRKAAVDYLNLITSHHLACGTS